MTITGQSIVKCQQAIGIPDCRPTFTIDRGFHPISDWERVSAMFSSAASIPSNKGRTPVFIFAETFCLEGNKEISGEDYFCGSWFSFENCHEKILREMVQIQGLESGIIYVNFSLIIIYLNEIFILFSK